MKLRGATDMKITVNEQAQKFYLASKTKWARVVGHEIKVGKYQFCAIPLSERINVSEVTSGTKITEYKIDSVIYLLTSTKEGTIQLCYMIGEMLKTIIEKTEDFDEKLEIMQIKSFEMLGEKPPTEDFDIGDGNELE